jgi:hypothetical protein
MAVRVRAAMLLSIAQFKTKLSGPMASRVCGVFGKKIRRSAQVQEPMISLTTDGASPRPTCPPQDFADNPPI